MKFDTVAELEGLRSDSAKQYVSQILKKRSLVDPVLQFNDKNFISDPGFASPLLLSFISILADNGELDLTKKNVAVGEIYFKLVRFLFNKYILKQGSKYSEEMFMDFLVRVGEVGLKGMIEGGPWKMQELGQFDVDPLEVGILTLHETSSGLSDPNAMLVTFAHSTLQYFFGSMRFTYGPIKGIASYSIAFSTMLSFFFYFCIWASGSKTSPIASEAKSEAYNAMASFVAEEIDAEKFDFSVICERYPPIKLCSLSYQISKRYIEFIHKTVSLLRKVKHVVLDKTTNVDDVIEILQPLWQQATTVQILQGDIKPSVLKHIQNMSSRENLTIITDVLTSKNSLLSHCEIKDRNFSWYILPSNSETSTDFSMFSWSNLEEVHINPLVDRSLEFARMVLKQQLYFKKPHIIFSADVFEAPRLKRLSLCNLLIDRKNLVFISTAMREGKLPKLTDLTLAGSDLSSEGSNLVFLCRWPSLTDLDMNECTMSKDFVTPLQHAFRNNLFPELMSLNLPGKLALSFPTLPSRLTELSFADRFSVSKLIYRGRLHDCFQRNSFPLLQTLVLRNCMLNSQDVISLAEARVEDNSRSSNIWIYHRMTS